MEKKKQSNKQPKKEGKSKTKCNLLEYLRNIQDYSYPKSYQIDNLIKKFDQTVEKFDKIVKKSRKWNIVMVVLTFLLTFLTIRILFLGFKQLEIINEYQNWSRKEMSRKPDLSLQVNKIDTLITSNSLKFYCSLLNTGDDIAQNVQFRHRLSQYIMPDDSGKFALKVTEFKGVVPFSDEGKPYIKIAVYEYAKIIYYEEDEDKDYELKLPYTWELYNIPTTARVLAIEYTIHSDRGAFKKVLSINNPFYDAGNNP